MQKVNLKLQNSIERVHDKDKLSPSEKLNMVKYALHSAALDLDHSG